MQSEGLPEEGGKEVALLPEFIYLPNQVAHKIVRRHTTSIRFVNFLWKNFGGNCSILAVKSSLPAVAALNIGFLSSAIEVTFQFTPKYPPAMALEHISIVKILVDILKMLWPTLTDEDRREFTKLIRALTNYRILTSAMEAEYAGSVISSAQNLRQLLHSTAQALPEHSELANGILSLGGIVRQFITEVERIEANIRHQLDLIVANKEDGLEPDDSNLRFLKHWTRHGYPQKVLRDNHNLNVTQIEWEGYRIQFLLALGALRGQFSLLLSLLCETMHFELPKELAALTPGIDELGSEGN